MGKRGTVVSVYVKNFGTYNQVEMRPGQNLNLILGPNGTGKSTLVSAIILGLGGNPKVIGRAAQIGDYVKTNRQEAEIKIELDSGDNEQNDIICRKFNKQNHTSWELNRERVHFKEIQKLVNKYKIQIDNLCQFLPQDRVQDFAKMNNRELLLNTQKSVGPAELVEYHKELVECRVKHKDLESQSSRQGNILKDEEQKNSRLAGLVRNIQEKRELMKDIDNVKCKIAWLNYDDLREQALDVKKDRDKLSERLRTLEEQMKPAETAVSNAKISRSQIQETLLAINRLKSDASNRIKESEERTDETVRSISNVKRETERKIQQENQRNGLIAEAKNKAFKLKNDLDHLVEENGSENEIDKQMHQILPKVNQTEKQIDKLNKKKTSLEYDVSKINAQVRALEHEKRATEDVGRQKLEMLQRLDKDAYQAVLWLRDNQDKFRHRVYEPIMLEIDVKNKAHAKFVENVIAYRDLCAFTCEDSEDMNNLLRYLRDQQKLKINAVHSGEQHTPFSEFRHPIPIAQLQKFGLFAYLSNLVTGPEAIMKYLCRTYRLHNIPIGNEATFKYSSQIPPQINRFFSENHQFTSSASRYTGEKSTRTNEIGEARILTGSMDRDRLNELQRSIIEYNAEKTQLDQEINNINNQIKALNDSRIAYIDHKKQLQETKDQIRTLKARLNAALANVRNLEEESLDVEAERQRCKEKVQEFLTRMIQFQQKTMAQFKKFQSHIHEALLKQTELSIINEHLTGLVNEYQNMKQNCNDVENTLQRIKAQFDHAKQDAKTAFEAAKRLSNGLTPNDEGFNELSEIFDKLPDTKNEMEEIIIDKQTQVDLMNTADDNVATEYENRLKEIEKLTGQKERTTVQIADILARINELKEKWLGPLREFVDRINTRFGDYFRRMGCAGEVVIKPAENELDFDQYGLCIKVRYRDNQPLQELNQHVQSGGERAVATAIYMLSLQELTHVPFRCVDEINQGMDAINERKIFELIVDSTSDEHMPQYFLLTPKLLPGLKYVRTMRIHIIHNGPYEVEGNQYDHAEICQRISSAKNSQSY